MARPVYFSWLQFSFLPKRQRPRY